MNNICTRRIMWEDKGNMSNAPLTIFHVMEDEGDMPNPLLSVIILGQKSKYGGVGDVPHPHLIYKIKSDKKTMSWREKILLKTIRIKKDEEVTENYENFIRLK